MKAKETLLYKMSGVRQIATLMLWMNTLCITAADGVAPVNIDSVFRVLDSTIANADVYMTKKLNVIRQISMQLSTKRGKSLGDTVTSETGGDSDKRFKALLNLYDEYRNFNNDSALQCLFRCRLLAEKTADKQKLTTVWLQLAHQYVVTGYYIEAQMYFQKINPKQLPPSELPSYYHYQSHLYRELEMYTEDPLMCEEYHRLSMLYRDSLEQVSDHQSAIYLQRRCISLCADGNYKDARTVNDKWKEMVEEGTLGYSRMAFYRAEIYEQDKDTDRQKFWLAKAAISEIECCDLNLIALWKLAECISNEKDIDRAMRYIDFSWNSISRFSTHKRAWFIAPILNDIHGVYQNKVTKAHSQLFYLAIISCMLAAFFLSALIYAVRKRKVAVAARAELSMRNQQLSELNEQLSTLNSQLKDSNRVKDEYIRDFLQMCSTYIDKMDNYRVRVNRKLKANQVKDLMRMTDSEEMRNEERQELMDHFDAVFLHLFPTFISDFNQLLKPEARIYPVKPLSMNTVLRIFALVRLGIDESAKIADFLDYSANSIYNYRSRIKKDAIGQRDEFEAQVKIIGL